MKKRKKRKNLKNKNKKKKLGTLFLVLMIFGLLCLFFYTMQNETSLEEKTNTLVTNYLASDTTTASIYSLNEVATNEAISINLEKEGDVVRGTEVITDNETITYQDEVYKHIFIDDIDYYVNSDNLVSDYEKVVLEKVVYTRSATNILENTDDYKINGYAPKASELEVVSYDEIDEEGNVNFYYVDYNDTLGYVYGKYMTFTKEEASQNYQADVYDQIYSAVSNAYGGGEAIKLDYYPHEKGNFEDNVMPDSVYALYLNCGSNVISNIDEYIEFAKTTKINAFVIDIKDNESPAFPAKTFETLSPTNYSHAINSYDDYKNAITKLKEAGFYVIGRITVFKDSYYVKDHPENAILDISTNSPYLHNGSYWPSAYSRDVWYYNVSLAREAASEFGFNEINFDYVRFPDRMNSVSDKVNLRNSYNEDKAEAILQFVTYATDVLHEMGVYVSVDVFGETTNGTYTTAYGQYWPAISNVVDVISGMPYPDHFSAGSYGIAKPWNNPYLLMNYWGRYASDRQKETPSPAKVRTWIQAYDVMKYVDANGISYGAKEVEDEIKGLFDSGITDGYITWLSSSSLEKYRTQKGAFQVDYLSLYTS